MKRYVTIFLMILCSLSLASCVHHSQNALQTSFFQETWRNKVDHHVDSWAKGATQWFFTGRTQLDSSVPSSNEMSTTKVQVPYFTDIQVEGAFQVQLEGSDDHHSVVLRGPYQAVRSVSVEVSGHTLYLRQAASSPDNMPRVIVSVGVVDLHYLDHKGPGLIEGAHVHSDGLDIHSIGEGNIYLQGDIMLTRIVQQGEGSINVFGAKAHELDIKASGTGDIGISGKVGIRSIVRHGCGEVNIIGAQGHDLTISADSDSKIGLRGRVAVREIRAKDQAGVYIEESHSDNMHVYIANEAEVGVAGIANNLSVNATDQAVFYGRYLRARNAFVKTEDDAHVNVMATNKIYASASDNSSIYFFGPPAILSSVMSDAGVVVSLAEIQEPANAKPLSPFFQR